LDLLPFAGASSTRLPFFPSKIAPTASSPEVKLVAISNNSFESTGGLRPSSRTRSRYVVSSRKACTISDWATLGSSVQLLEKRRMKSRSDSPGFWVHARRSQEFPGRTYEGADQIVPVVDLAGRQVLKPRPRRVGEVQRRL
jgi:hypothetical protein